MSKPTMKPSSEGRRVSFLLDKANSLCLKDGDACLQMLLNGAYFIKVRPRGHYPRLFRLEPDFSALTWTPTAKHGSVDLKDVHEIRRGRNSPLLMDPDLDVQERYAFSIVHGPEFSFLDMVAENEEEANFWQTVLSFIIHLHKDNVTTPLTEAELTAQVVSYVHDYVCTPRPEIQYLVSRYGNGWYITIQNFRHFLCIEQHHEVSLKKCAKLIQDYEPDPTLKANLHISWKGLAAYLHSPHGNVFNHNKRTVYQDMTQPLCNYFISSSHNSYLSTSQKEGMPSLGAFHRVLIKGSRYIEIDLYEGPKSAPVVRHHKFGNSSLELAPLAKLIAATAFTASEYPLIVRIEHHCSVHQQRKAVEIFNYYLGNMLCEGEHSDMSDVPLPSPEELKRKIILVTKRLSSDLDPRGCDGDGFVSEDDDSFEPPCLADPSRANRTRRRSTLSVDATMSVARHNSWSASLSSWPVSDSRSKSVGVSPAISRPSIPILTAVELSQISCVFSLRSFSSWQFFEPAFSRHLWSFNNELISMLSESNQGVLVQRHQRSVSRVFPSFRHHNDSSNFLPTLAWACGAQCVALNWQTICTEMDVTMSMFSDNGGCGYVLRPSTLNNSTSASLYPSGVTPTEITVKILSGQNLPDPYMSSFPTDVLDPYVKVSIYGAQYDNDVFKTKTCRNCRDNPRWHAHKTFRVRFPDLAQIRFHVLDADSIGSDFIGHCTMPVRCLSTGYRHVELRTPDDTVIKDASLLVHITCNKLSPYSNFGRKTAKKTRKEALLCRLTMIQELDLHFKKYNALLTRAVDLCYPAESVIHELKAACRMSASATILEVVRSLVMYNGFHTDPVCMLRIEDGLFPILTITHPKASDVVESFVTVLNNGMDTIRNCLRGASPLIEEMQTQITETREQWPNVPELVKPLGLKSKYVKKALSSYDWNVGLLEMEISEIKESAHRVKVAMKLLAECFVCEGLAALAEV